MPPRHQGERCLDCTEVLIAPAPPKWEGNVLLDYTIDSISALARTFYRTSNCHSGKLMSSEADNAFVRATDDLIGLYRSVERNTLDLPLVSFMPFLIFLWATLRFSFFLCVGLFLIIPTNFVILIRNLFPGHWRYRPFFLRHIYYVWLWIWRGEAPTAPFILIRPLLSLFMKGHFERRLRRLRHE